MPNYLYKTLPMQHQEEAFYFVYSLFQRGINYAALLMEMGTGKTKTAIDIASNLYAEKKIDAVMVIAPNGVQSQWQTEQVPEHSPIPYTDFIWSNTASKRYAYELKQFLLIPNNVIKWFYVNVEAFSSKNHLDVFKAFVSKHRTLVIVDEATRIKTPESARTINIIQGLSSITKAGKVVTSVLPISAYRLILTGMQTTNSPFDLWSMFEFLQHNYFGRDYNSFQGRYGLQIRSTIPGSRRGYFRSIQPSEMQSVRKYVSSGKSLEDVSRIMGISESSAKFIVDNPALKVPYKNLDELKALVSKVSYQVLKKDCLDLPPKTYEKIYVDPSSEQLQIYKDLKKDLEAEYGYATLSVANAISMLVRLQQVTGGFFPAQVDEDGAHLSEPIPILPNPKLNALLANLDEATEYPIIVVAAFVSEIKAIRDALHKHRPDLNVRIIYGKVPVAERNVIREDFDRGEVDVLVGNAVCIGTGFNLQRSHVQYFYSNNYSLEQRSQMEDRTHRKGQKADNVLYKDIIMRGTIDETVYRVLRSKRELLDFMRDKSAVGFLGGAS